MAFIDDLPEEVAHLVRSGMVCEYVSLTAKGVPMNTPAYYFPNAEETTLDVGTGLAYPAKAERARRNPKVGLLIERAAGEPVVSIAGYAAVQDADIQANLHRYAAETAHMLPPGGTWEAMRKSVFYWSRIFIAVKPAHIWWWPNQEAAANEAPREWRAPPGTVYPPSDPKPAGMMSKAPDWPQMPWQQAAEEALGRAAPGHLSLCDGEGFPIPLRATDIERIDGGFRMTVPRSAPWEAGMATLSFQGREVFVGEAVREGQATILNVERAMPIFPLTTPDLTVPRPSRETRALLNARLEQELARRGLPVPIVPEDMPEPTRHSLLRIEALKAQLAGSFN